jgi:hypothetical protein
MDVRFRCLQHVSAYGGRHAHADQPASVTDLPGFGDAFIPAEATCAFTHAFDDLAGRKRDAEFGIHGGLVADAQFDRVDVERDGKLIHGAFEREEADRLARRAHRNGGRQVQIDLAVRIPAVLARIAGTRAEHRRFEFIVAGLVTRPRFMRLGKDMALRIRAQANALHGVGAVPHDVKELLAGEGKLDLAARGPGGQRGQHRVGLYIELATEAATDISGEAASALRPGVGIWFDVWTTSRSPSQLAIVACGSIAAWNWKGVVYVTSS